MDSAVKPFMDAPVWRRNLATALSGMVKKRQLATTSRVDKPKRTPRALGHADGMMALRRAVAANVKWILENSSAAGSVPKMHYETGLGINTIRRLLRAERGATIDTLAVIADTYGVPAARIFTGLTEKDQHMVKMLANMQKDSAVLKARAGP